MSPPAQVVVWPRKYSTLASSGLAVAVLAAGLWMLQRDRSALPESEPVSALLQLDLRDVVLLSLFGLAAGAGLWGVIERFMTPRRQLIQEIRRLSSGENGTPLLLPPGHPYQEVTDFLHRQHRNLEWQSKVIAYQHHRQQVLINNITEGILAVDNSMRITALNPIAADWLGIENHQRVHGSPLTDCCTEPTLLCLVEELLQSGEVREAQLTTTRKDGINLRVELRGSLLVDQDQAAGVLVLLRDVTTLRRLETLRKDFVANVSHELRTPLTSIKGYAELLDSFAEDGEKVKQFGCKILSQSDRMINIIDDLLSLARIENAESRPAMVMTDLRPLLENVAGLCEESARRRNLELEIDVPVDTRAPMHPPLFEQAVMNLVQNAVKYTHPHTVVTLAAFEENGTCVVEVRDRGPGIPRKHHDRLFERFYRVDKARSREVGGTGLGLSIVKHIAQLHGGNIEVRSVPDQETVFRLSLPVTETKQ